MTRHTMSSSECDALAWDKMDGLLPAMVQDANSRAMLMLGYMNREALEATISSGRVTFFSRSKQRLWQKGESSGHVLALQSVHADCDGDALLVLAQPHGPTCHTGAVTCFGEAMTPGVGFLGALDRLIKERHREQPEGSYTTKLFRAGTSRMAQKVGEEGVEVALAAMVPEIDGLREEAGDLLYHLVVLLRDKGLGLEEVVETLRLRHESRKESVRSKRVAIHNQNQSI